MLIKMDRTGKTKSVFKCDRCKKRLVTGSRTRYKIAVHKTPRTYKTINKYDLCEECYIKICKYINGNIMSKKEKIKEKEFIYSVKERSLTGFKENDEPIFLTKREAKLFEVLANGKLNTFEEITKYIYGYHDLYSYRTVLSIKSLLCKKTKLDITVIRNNGFRLNNIIYIE